jgi:hypothetical protein
MYASTFGHVIVAIFVLVAMTGSVLESHAGWQDIQSGSGIDNITPLESHPMRNSGPAAVGSVVIVVAFRT